MREEDTSIQRGIPDTLLFAIVAAVAGSVAAGLLIGWHQIDPANIAWLRKDPAVYQAGWEFLRRAEWRFPPTWLAHLDFPFGISAAYLDVIPLAALLLKPVSALLPSDFQYLGVYVLLCLVLQTWFALRLMTRFTADKVIILIGALFFLASPILLMRLLGHFSLCSQWLILASLYCYFHPIRTSLVSYLRPFALLLGISAGIAPYLSVMVLGIALAALARVGFEDWKRSPASMFTHVLAVTALFVTSLLVSLILFGFITPGAMPAISTGGYGAFSMNLLGPMNPSGTSLLFRSFAVFPAQAYEGYNYLGAGVIILGVICLARDPSLVARLWRPELRPLVIASFIFVLLALSTKVTLGQTVVAKVPLPGAAIRLLAVFRSSGRFFWPVHELLTLGALIGTVLTIQTRWPSRIVLAAFLLLQVFDVLPIMQLVARESAIIVTTPLVASDWQLLARTHRHLIVLPARQCDSMRTPGGDPAWPWFAALAARSGMTLNSVHAARSTATSEAYNCQTLPREIAQGRLQRDTAYVLSDPLTHLASARNRSHLCRRVDGFNLCTVQESQPLRRAGFFGRRPGTDSAT